MPKNRTSQLRDYTGIDGRELERAEYIENFLLRPGLNADHDAAASYSESGLQANLDKNPHFEVVGTNAASANATFADGGGVTLTTGTTSGDQMILTPHLDTGLTAWAATKWNTNDKVGIATIVKTGASVEDAIVWAGLKLTNTSVVATDDNQVMFRYAAGSNDGKLTCVYSVAGDDVTIETDIEVAASTSYLLEIEINGDRKATFYVNGDAVAMSTALAADTDLIPYVGVQTAAAAAKAITVRKVAMAKDLLD